MLCLIIKTVARTKVKKISFFRQHWNIYPQLPPQTISSLPLLANMLPLRTVLRTMITTRRPIHTSTSSRAPYKDSQDRESLRTGTDEHTKSGRDEDIARDRPDIAFNAHEPRPEEAATRSAKKGKTGADPLAASGANKDISKPVKENDAGTEVRKGGASREKSPQKKGKLPRA